MESRETRVFEVGYRGSGVYENRLAILHKGKFTDRAKNGRLPEEEGGHVICR